MSAQTTHDDDDKPAEIDFSGAKRGQFYRAGAQLNLPVYLDQQVQATPAALASAKGLICQSSSMICSRRILS